MYYHEYDEFCTIDTDPDQNKEITEIFEKDKLEIEDEKWTKKLYWHVTTMSSTWTWYMVFNFSVNSDSNWKESPITIHILF